MVITFTATLMQKRGLKLVAGNWGNHAGHVFADYIPVGGESGFPPGRTFGIGGAGGWGYLTSTENEVTSLRAR